MSFKSLEGYKPEAPKDNDFEPMKGTFACVVNFARVEPYEGDDELKQGHNIFRYELEIVDHTEYSGRRLWKRYDLDTEDVNGKTKKTPAQDLADLMFKLGLELGNTPESITDCLEKFAGLVLEVNCWHFKGKDDKAVQMHTIRGINSTSISEGEKGSTPF